MHTGYDNFWMHKNNRLKPVLNLPKNDNYSCALLPDNYKNMQSRGCPSQLSSFIPPQNNTASSHEKDHYRNSHDQSMWPSSVYSLPFIPSYANNLHPQESFFSHTNNFVYSSPNPQAQDKHDFRHLEMSNGNVNILTMHNTNTSTLANSGLAHTQHNKNNTQIPRIRVKDVFTLNNKGVQGQLNLDGHFGIRQQKELLVNSAHYNRTSESQIQTEYTNYNNANFVESSKSSQYEHRTAKQTCLTNQEQFQGSCSFYLQKDGFSRGDFEFSSGRQIESSLSSESFQSSTPASLFGQFLTQDSVPGGGLQSCQGKTGGHGNSQPRPEGVKVTTMRNLAELHDPNYSDSNYSRSCGLNVRAPENCTSLKNVNNIHCDTQENSSKINEVNLKSRNSASNIMSKNAPSITSKSPPLKEINSQQNDFIKIKIPHIDKSSFNRINDCDDTERNSAVNLQSFFEQSDKNCVVDRNTNNIIDEQNGVVNSIPPPVGQSSFVSHHASSEAASIRESSANEGGTITHKNSVPAVSASLISSPTNCQQDSVGQRPHRQEFDVLSNEDGDFFQHSTRAPEIIQQKFAAESSGRDDSTPEQGIPTNDFTATPLTLKQESFHSEIESASLQRAKNPPRGKEFHPTIKTEENLTARECEPGLQPPDVVNEALPKFQVEGGSSTDKSRSDSAAVADQTDKVNTLKSSSIKREDVQKSEGKETGRKVSLPKVNYKSNINRDKLDLLIQFLKKDQDSGGSSSCKERQSCRETASNANSESHRSRRKLNKASIVRNKNNSREMISLMSPKSSTFTCKASQITERSKNSEEIEAGKNSCSKDKLMAEESVDVSKERIKRNNSCQDNESKKDDSWMTEPSNEVACLSKQQFQESSEKPVPKDMCTARNENAIISTVRAFQNSKTHFCVSCKLVSPIESFWINVVSGEVRCLNCFKRTLKAQTKENVLKSKSNDLRDSSVEPLLKRKSKTEKENKSRDSATVGGSNSWDEGERKQNSKCEDALRKLNGMKENVREELLEMFVWKKPKSNERKETTNCLSHTRRSSSGDGVDSQKGKPSEEKLLKTEKSARTDISSEEVGKRFSEIGSNQGMKDINVTRKRKSSSEEEDFAKRERHLSSVKYGKTSIPKEQYSEGGAKEETVIKSEKSHGRRASRSEDGPENRAKKETKGIASSNTRRSSYDSGEEFRYHSVSAIEERGQKDLKIRHCTDESRKPPSKEGWPARKDHAAEEAAKRSARHETSDKSKNENIWREGHLQRGQNHHSEAKTSKLVPRRDPKAPDALARSTYHQDGIESQKRMESTEQPRKRKNSDEDFSPRKVHILQDFIKRGSVQATHPSKSPEAKASKEYDNPHRSIFWSPRISAEKSGRSDQLREECVVLGEHLSKEAKPPPEKEKPKVKHLWKGPVVSERAKPSEPAKGRATGFVEQPRRKSKDEERGPEKGVGWRRVSETSERPRRKSFDEDGVPRNILRISGEGKRENLAENREKRKLEEKEGNRSAEKMPKVSPLSPYVLDTLGKDGQSRRPDGAWRLFREKQSSKSATGAPYGA